MYAKDPYEAKYQFFVNKRESIGLKHFNDPKAFTVYSNDMQDVHKKYTAEPYSFLVNDATLA